MDSSKNHRSLTITWEDPKVSARDSSAISGIDYLMGIRDGAISPPPIAKLVGYKIVEVEKGGATFELNPAEYHYNPFSSVHGGITTTLLDTSMAASVLSTLPIGKNCSTVEFKVNFIRPITSKTGKITCRAAVIHSGGRIATSEAKIFDASEKLFAHAVSTIMIF